MEHVMISVQHNDDTSQIWISLTDDLIHSAGSRYICKAPSKLRLRNLKTQLYFYG